MYHFVTVLRNNVSLCDCTCNQYCATSWNILLSDHKHFFVHVGEWFCLRVKPKIVYHPSHFLFIVSYPIYMNGASFSYNENECWQEDNVFAITMMTPHMQSLWMMIHSQCSPGFWGKYMSWVASFCCYDKAYFLVHMLPRNVLSWLNL